MKTSFICENNGDKIPFGILFNSKFLKNSKEETKDKKNLQETIYRRGGTSIEKLIEYDPDSKLKIKITNYDYFDDKKIKSIEEFNPKTGLPAKITSFTLFKSITEFDAKTGKKIKTTNYDIKDENKKTSVYDFDINLEKISRITTFRSDGVAINSVRELDPATGIIIRAINYKKNSTAISSVSKYDFDGDKTIKTTFYYNTPIYFTNPAAFNKKITADLLNKKILDDSEKKRMTKLIDNLYKNNLNLSSISI